MSKRITGKLGTYTNDGLGTGLAFIEFEKDELISLRAYISAKEAKIKCNFRLEICRIDAFLKDKFKVIPKEETFSKWFFDKQSIKEENFNITDDDLIEYTLIYLKELEFKINKQLPIKAISFKWYDSELLLIRMFDDLVRGGYIAATTDLNTFKANFGLAPKNDTSRVHWLPLAKNKFVNKKGLYDFIDILEKRQLIEMVPEKATKFELISNTFSDKDGKPIELKSANESKDGDWSELRLELEKLIPKHISH